MLCCPLYFQSYPLFSCGSGRRRHHPIQVQSVPDCKSTIGDLPLSVSDLPMLSCHYIQKGLFFPRPPVPVASLLPLLTSCLARVLSLFPALAGRLSTRPDGRIFISCDDSGAEFYHAAAPSLTLPLLLPDSADVPAAVKLLFPLDGALSYHGHFLPISNFQLTELADGALFLGAVVNHAVVDGTSLWNFFNAWAEICRGGIPASPDLRRNYFGDSKAVLRFPSGAGPEVTFQMDAPLREDLSLQPRGNFRPKIEGQSPESQAR
ncbi:unnamed protein product [Musa acuminata var. zebrina]